MAFVRDVPDVPVFILRAINTRFTTARNCVS
jgi:hypothetical protein